MYYYFFQDIYFKMYINTKSNVSKYVYFPQNVMRECYVFYAKPTKENNMSEQGEEDIYSPFLLYYTEGFFLPYWEGMTFYNVGRISKMKKLSRNNNATTVECCMLPGNKNNIES